MNIKYQLNEWESTPVTSLAAMLAKQANYRPNAQAVISETKTLTMAELAEVASKIAGGLNQRVASLEECIGIYVEPSVDLINTIWGIIWSGRAYVPLAVEYPDDRIHYIVEQSEIRTVITQSHLEYKIKKIVPQNTKVIILEELISIGKQSSPVQNNKLNDLGYVIYTSGSTGRPKGVMISQAAIVNQLKWLRERGYLQPGVRILQKTPASFDAAQWELLAPAVGAAAVAGRPDLFRDIDGIIGMLRCHSVTTLQCVPTLLSNLLQHDDFCAYQGLTALFSGGEALSQNLAEKVLGKFPNIKFVNLYGPTECTINATYFEIDKSSLTNLNKAVPIGFPVNGVQCHLLDKNYNSVSDGQTGELYLSGIQLSSGYKNRLDLTKERFIERNAYSTLYRTGDLCTRDKDGVLHFEGRIDNQVKLRGYRVELEEINLAIESHPWVKHASSVVIEDQRTKGQILTACIELNEKEAALMDQGESGQHHQSKTDKLQVKAQLSSPGIRTDLSSSNLTSLSLLAGELDKSERLKIFQRKTYRFFEGEELTSNEINDLIDSWQHQMSLPQELHLPSNLDLKLIARALRWFRAIYSEERLLPKYAYASPGALYATQLYIECVGIDGIEDGIHYYHPLNHTLIRVCQTIIKPTCNLSSKIRFHFVGKKSAIEPVYKKNIREVLEMETGHMLGLMNTVLEPDGLGVRPEGYTDNLLQELQMHSEDFNLGSFDVVPSSYRWCPQVDIFIQKTIQPISGELSAQGLWQVKGVNLKRISNQSINLRDVIAINQQVFKRSSIGISAISRESEPHLEYVALGYALDKFQRNQCGIGFMSSGYSSKTGNPLPSSLKLNHILDTAGIPSGPMYFFIGGKISDSQMNSEGMKEDQVHMQGPAEMIREELLRTLPDYMIPNKVVLFEQLPLSANGKVDHKAVAASEQLHKVTEVRPYVAPATDTEKWFAALWSESLEIEEVSSEDDFFLSGGNSLNAISMLAKIYSHFGVSLPAQTIFESPKLKDLAKIVDQGFTKSQSRVVLMNDGVGHPVFCWPGLGGYPMRLRKLAQSSGRRFYGIQTHGINNGEELYKTISDMAKADIDAIKKLNLDTPVTLWGYSFGARLAFETAWQLEQLGQSVSELVLICPGNPQVASYFKEKKREATFDNPVFIAVLLSVFLGHIDLEMTKKCLARCQSQQSFVEFIKDTLPDLNSEMIQRITHIVFQTYEFEYGFEELKNRQLNTPITIIKAKGDDYSFIENTHGFSINEPRVIQLPYDHYQVLEGSPLKNMLNQLNRTSTKDQVKYQKPTSSLHKELIDASY